MRLARPAGYRHTAEFCENGAKAVAWESQRDSSGQVLRRASHLGARAAHQYWLESQGRLTHPDGAPRRRRPGTSRSRWDDAFALVAEHLQALPTRTQPRSTSGGPPSRGRGCCRFRFVVVCLTPNAGAADAGRGRVLHLGRASNEAAFVLPAVRPRLRNEQPARL
ncbi:hypothetical protein HBB16_02220 [Pseudonocardia sp. MCCB 268]|nr:hypothetical protein [Pseudonocardia cytotoxica]